MKRAKNLIIMAAALAVLAAGYFVWVRPSTVDTGGEGSSTEGETYTAVDINPTDLEKITVRIRRTQVDSESGEEKNDISKLSFHLNESSDKWIWDENESVPLDNSKFAALCTALMDKSSDYKLDIPADKLSDYGLAEPVIEVSFGFPQGRTETYFVGMKNTFNGLYYFSHADRPTEVYMVDAAVKDALDIDIYDMILFDTLPTLTVNNLSTLSFSKGEDKFVFTRYPSGNSRDYTDAYNWYFSVNGGEQMPVSTDFAGNMESALTYMSLIECVSFDKSEEGEFGFDDPIKLTVGYKVTETVTDSSSSASSEITREESFSLWFGGDDGEDHRYVRTDTSGMIYTLYYSSFFSQLFEAKQLQILPQEIIALNMDNVSSVTLSANGKTFKVDITHGADTDVYTDGDGKELDAATLSEFNAVLEALGKMKATSDTSVVGKGEGFSDEEMFRAEFTFISGKHTSGEMKITRYGGNYCRVSFLGRDSQLVTLSDVGNLVDLVTACCQ